jgi:hypothetical protein
MRIYPVFPLLNYPYEHKPAARLSFVSPQRHGKSACRLASSGSRGIDVAGMDRSVAPGDDFFAYSTALLMKSTPGTAEAVDTRLYSFKTRSGCSLIERL